MNKLVKTAKTLDRVFKVLRVLVIVAGVITLAAMVLLGAVQLLTPETVAQTEDVLILGSVELSLAPGVGTQSLLPVLMAMGAVLVCIAMLLVFIHYFRQMLAPIREGKPFHHTVSKSLKKLAWVEIALGIVYNVLTVGEAVLVNRLYPLEALFSGSSVTGIGTYYELDLSFVLSAAVLFLLAYIFSYGAELQKLSDETL